MKREVEFVYDFKAFGQAIKKARRAAGYSRKKLGHELNLAPRYLVSIENEGQHPSLQVLYELCTFFDISVDQFFFPDKVASKSTQRRQLETLPFTGAGHSCQYYKFQSISSLMLPRLKISYEFYLRFQTHSKLRLHLILHICNQLTDILRYRFLFIDDKSAVLFGNLSASDLIQAHTAAR